MDIAKRAENVYRKLAEGETSVSELERPPAVESDEAKKRRGRIGDGWNEAMDKVKERLALEEGEEGGQAIGKLLYRVPLQKVDGRWRPTPGALRTVR